MNAPADTNTSSLSRLDAEGDAVPPPYIVIGGNAYWSETFTFPGDDSPPIDCLMTCPLEGGAPQFLDGYEVDPGVEGCSELLAAALAATKAAKAAGPELNAAAAEEGAPAPG